MAAAHLGSLDLEGAARVLETLPIQLEFSCVGRLDEVCLWGHCHLVRIVHEDVLELCLLGIQRTA